MLRVKLAAADTYVPQTGSFLSSPPDWMGVCRGALGARRLPVKKLRRIDLRKRKSNREGRNSRTTRNMGSGRKPKASAPESDYFFFFVVGAVFLLGSEN